MMFKSFYKIAVVGSNGFIGCNIAKGLGKYSYFNVEEIETHRDDRYFIYLYSYDVIVVAAGESRKYYTKKHGDKVRDDELRLVDRLKGCWSGEKILIWIGSIDAGQWQRLSQNNPYGWIKREVEEKVKRKMSINSSLYILRLPSVVGPRIKKGWIMDKIKLGPRPPMVHVDKVVEIIEDIICWHDVVGGGYNRQLIVRVLSEDYPKFGEINFYKKFKEKEVEDLYKKGIVDYEK